MARPTSIFIYLGTGTDGEELEALIKSEAKKRGYVKRSGEPNVSPFIVDCVKKVIEQEKSKYKNK